MTTIRVKALSAVLNDPFSEGHPLSAFEAQALNALRAENIRNNIAKKVEEGTTLEEFSRLVSEYDKTYSFGRRMAPTTLGTLEEEVERLLQERVEEEIRRRGPHGANPLYEEEVVQRLRQDPQILVEATQNLRRRTEVARQSLEELLT